MLKLSLAFQGFTPVDSNINEVTMSTSYPGAIDDTIDWLSSINNGQPVRIVVGTSTLLQTCTPTWIKTYRSKLETLIQCLANFSQAELCLHWGTPPSTGTTFLNEHMLPTINLMPPKELLDDYNGIDSVVLHGVSDSIDLTDQVIEHGLRRVELDPVRDTASLTQFCSLFGLHHHRIIVGEDVTYTLVDALGRTWVFKAPLTTVSFDDALAHLIDDESMYIPTTLPSYCADTRAYMQNYLPWGWIIKE